jgi:hypothetical protein
MEPTINVRLSDLTPEQRAQLMADAKAQCIAEEKKRKEDIATYKDLASEAVNVCFRRLQDVSANLANEKKAIRTSFESSIALKKDLYKNATENYSHTFINKTQDRRITLGHYVVDSYDDTVEDGVAKVKDYISSRGDSTLVKIAMQLLSRDQKGNLKASRVMQLQKIANESGDKDFIDGVQIIVDAYKPIASKDYIKAEYKNQRGEWINVPLGMTEAE